jgi:hypothetical protein
VTNDNISLGMGDLGDVGIIDLKGGGVQYYANLP